MAFSFVELPSAVVLSSAAVVGDDVTSPPSLVSKAESSTCSVGTAPLPLEDVAALCDGDGVDVMTVSGVVGRLNWEGAYGL